MIFCANEYSPPLEKVPWCKDNEPICKALRKPISVSNPPLDNILNGQTSLMCLVSADLRKKCPFACESCSMCGIVKQVKGICESDLGIKEICPNECQQATKDMEGTTNSIFCFLSLSYKSKCSGSLHYALTNINFFRKRWDKKGK